MRIGIISDTHCSRGLDELGPEAAAFCSSVDLILHNGDVQASAVLDWLEQFAPVIACRGNHDGFNDPRMPDVVMIEREGWRIGMAHAIDDDPRWADRVTRMKRVSFAGAELDILLAGDSHYERIEYQERTLLLNSGSTTLPHKFSTRWGGVGLLELTRERGHAEIIRIGESPGLPNPTRVGHIDFTREGVLAASADGAPIVATDGVVRWPQFRGPDDQF